MTEKYFTPDQMEQIKKQGEVRALCIFFVVLTPHAAAEVFASILRTKRVALS